MRYRYSQEDNSNLEWFEKDLSCSTLLGLELLGGRMRGLSEFRIDFKYPITVIAGENGSGKSTLLAMVACAYHNKKDGYLPFGKKRNYYTFSDFFVQSPVESAPEGIWIIYDILHGSWRKSAALPEGKGRGSQLRHKGAGGKWNNYDQRVPRNVVFFGVQRVVPHSEQSAYCSYRRQFKGTDAQQGWEQQVLELAGRIIGKSYTKLEFHTHSKYRLPVVDAKRGSGSLFRYSGFNMGAGENAVFSILLAIFEAGRGSLLVIDEIELGLHEKAQARLIHVLKNLCREMHVQIVCSSHSPIIINAVPPEGRFYIESVMGTTIVTPEISAQYAAGKLSGENSRELDIFVEDDLAKDLIISTLPQSLRERVQVFFIGSDGAVIRQMAARRKDLKTGECIMVLDGDKRAHRNRLNNHFIKHLENPVGKDFQEDLRWLEERTCFLPGDTYPEKWIFDNLSDSEAGELTRIFGTSASTMADFIMRVQRAEKHEEFHELSEYVHRDKEAVRSRVCEVVARNREQQFSDLMEAFLRILS